MSAKRRRPSPRDPEVLEVRGFLRSYRLCGLLRDISREEREALLRDARDLDTDIILRSGETFWRARMYEVGKLIDSLPNTPEKIYLYCRYIRGESTESIADRLSVSRRTGYRLQNRALVLAAQMREKLDTVTWLTDEMQ